MTDVFGGGGGVWTWSEVGMQVDSQDRFFIMIFARKNGMRERRGGGGGGVWLIVSFLLCEEMHVYIYIYITLCVFLFWLLLDCT